MRDPQPAFFGAIPQEIAELWVMSNPPGWTGTVMRHQEEGALPNGTRVVKTISDPEDAHEDGELGTVLGSIAVPETAPHLMYCVEWDSHPRTSVFTIDLHVRAADGT